MAGAKRAREVVLSVLCDACNEGDLSIPEALEAVTDIFAENAKTFYKINNAVKSMVPRPVSDTPSKLDNHVKREFYSTQQDVVLVRIIWVDTSGQHRCRVRNFPYRTYILPNRIYHFPPFFDLCGPPSYILGIN